MPLQAPPLPATDNTLQGWFGGGGATGSGGARNALGAGFAQVAVDGQAVKQRRKEMLGNDGVRQKGLGGGSSDSASDSDDGGHRCDAPRPLASKKPRRMGPIERLANGGDEGAVVEWFVSPATDQNSTAVIALQAALEGVAPAQASRVFRGFEDREAADRWVREVLAACWGAADAHGDKQELRQLQSADVSVTAKIGLFQALARRSREASRVEGAAVGAAPSGASVAVQAAQAAAMAAAQVGRSNDLSVDALDGRAPPNPTTTARIADKAAVQPFGPSGARPAALSEEQRWLAGHTGVAVPKAAIMFNMSDDSSRKRASGFLQPQTMHVLNADRQRRADRVRNVLDEVLGQGAAQQLSKHVQAVLSMQFSRLETFATLEAPRSVVGSMGISIAHPRAPRMLILQMNAQAVIRAYPEVDMSVFSATAYEFSKIIQSERPQLVVRAQELYDQTMKSLEKAAGLMRNDTTDFNAPLKLPVDAQVFAAELKEKVERAVVNSRTAEADQAAGALPSPQKPAAGGGSAIARGMGVTTLTGEQVGQLRTKWGDAFNGTCFYEAIAKCNNSSCAMRHTGLPSAEEKAAWIAKITAEMSLK